MIVIEIFGVNSGWLNSEIHEVTGFYTLDIQIYLILLKGSAWIICLNELNKKKVYKTRHLCFIMIIH